MRKDLPHITFVIRDIEGGVASMNHQIIENADFGRYFNVHVVLWRSVEEQSKSFREIFSHADELFRFEYSQYDNNYHMLRRFSDVLNKWPGILVTNDGVELEAIKIFGTSSVIFSIVHDFYNLRLAIQSLPWIDYFLCHTEAFTKTLMSSYHLRDRVKFLLHGVKTSPTETGNRKTPADKITIVSISRLTDTKGVQHFAAIDELLIKKGIGVEWKIVGSGELEDHLRRQWSGKTNIGFYQPDTHAEVLAIARTGDIFISPSIFEGYGIALLEAMSCGLVPVIHKLPVGIYSNLPADIGFSVEPGEIGSFADHIATLHQDRDLLHSMGNNAARLIRDKYDISKTAEGFMEFFRANGGLAVINRPVHYRKAETFGLLDRPYIPNPLTRLIKRLRS